MSINHKLKDADDNGINFMCDALILQKRWEHQQKKSK